MATGEMEQRLDARPDFQDGDLMPFIAKIHIDPDYEIRSRPWETISQLYEMVLKRLDLNTFFEIEVIQ